jgi:ABC-type branched-subunit amino acid transport system ATPase component
MILLEARRLSKHFGGIQAVRDFSFQIRKEVITALIGPNGAGKTTVFNLITGHLLTSAGEVVFNRKRIDGLPPHLIVQSGIARTFQLVRIFPKLTVLDNVVVGLRAPKGENLWNALFKPRGMKDETAHNREKAFHILEQVGLVDYKDQYAQNLGFGQQKLVEIARALATEPELLLLDEPTAGLSQDMTLLMRNLIRDLKEGGKTVLFIEHDMRVVMDISDWIYVLNYGEKIAEGKPEEIKRDPRVIQAYLGSE